MTACHPAIEVRRLDPSNAGRVLDLVRLTRTPETAPPDYEPSLEEVEGWFVGEDHGFHAHVCGVFGVFDEQQQLHGVVALQPLALDDREFLEFMIFFDTRGAPKGMPLHAAKVVVDASLRQTTVPIATLVFHRNTRAKGFYAKAGFALEREVDCDGYRLELWRHMKGAS
jgi:RimJ/RimL family protein N-acetyltransferase